MRIFNRRQMQNAPRVEAGNLYLGDVSDAQQVINDKVRTDAYVAKVRAHHARARAAAVAKENESRRIYAAQMHGAMLARSLKQSGHAVHAAGKRQGNGFIRQYGINNALLGFVDEVDESDYSQSDVMNANEFNNHLTAKCPKEFLHGKDWPLVVDGPTGDFSGILSSEAGSPDFSSFIVNDVKQDFGYVPQPRRTRRR